MGERTAAIESAELTEAKLELDKITGIPVAVRLWIYRVAIAVLLITTTFTTWQAITLEQWTQLLNAVLMLSGAGVANLARKNITP